MRRLVIAAALVTVAAATPPAGALPNIGHGRFSFGLLLAGHRGQALSFTAMGCSMTASVAPGAGYVATGTSDGPCMAGCSYVLTAVEWSFPACATTWAVRYRDAEPVVNFEAVVL